MSIRVYDRLSGVVCELRGGAALLGRYLVDSRFESVLFVNSFAVPDSTFLVPDSGGRWMLLSDDSERCEGFFPRAQVLHDLDASSIRAVGHALAEVVARGGTWLDAFDVSPLVPEMSKRAELQPLELLLTDDLGHLKEVCERPRMHLRVEVERTAVSRARRFPPHAPNFLAAHTEDWERPTLRAVIPKRILALVRDDQYDIYENRVVVRLVDNVVAYLGRRVLEVSRLLRVFEEAGDHASEATGGSHWRQNRIYQLWGEAVDAGEARRKAERTLRQLQHLKYAVAGLMDSVLYREVPPRATVSTTLTMTNILSNDVHYRKIADLWVAWARLGLDQTPRPREYFDEVQDLCRSFDGYSLLIALRALEQMGFEPTILERPLADREVALRKGTQSAVLSWAAADGVITLVGDGISPLRIVPLCSSIATLDGEQLRRFLAEVDQGCGTDVVTLVLYPTPTSLGAYDRLGPDLANRLHALSHEVSHGNVKPFGFLPVSPWDIGSVERVARQIRWVTTAPRFLAYPPTITRARVPDLDRGSGWLESEGDRLCAIRAPLKHEIPAIDRHVADGMQRVTNVQAERESVSRSLREAVRDHRGTGELNARKKALNAELADAERDVEALRRFQAELASAIASLEELLRCPTCGKHADPRREFEGGPGHHFSCTCSDCSATWGTVSCPRCGASIPVLFPSGRGWTTTSVAGWVDRTMGADVLAVPRIEGDETGFVCPSCGESRKERAALTPPGT